MIDILLTKFQYRVHSYFLKPFIILIYPSGCLSVDMAVRSLHIFQISKYSPHSQHMDHAFWSTTLVFGFYKNPQEMIKILLSYSRIILNISRIRVSTLHKINRCNLLRETILWMQNQGKRNMMQEKTKIQCTQTHTHQTCTHVCMYGIEKG